MSGSFFKTDAEDTSFSRTWIAQYGPVARKKEIALCVINRLVKEPVVAAAGWGQPLAGESLGAAKGAVDAFLVQDRSVAGRVARDIALIFASLGAIAVNRAALESVGLTDAALDGDPSVDPTARRAAIETISVARTIETRNNGGDGSPADVGPYVELHQDESGAGYGRALAIGAWGGIVTARMNTSGRLDADLPALLVALGLDGQDGGRGLVPEPGQRGRDFLRRGRDRAVVGRRRLDRQGGDPPGPPLGRAPDVGAHRSAELMQMAD